MLVTNYEIYISIAEKQRFIAPFLTGAFERGGRSCAWDYVVTVRPWGFRLEAIRVPVLLWHGELDQICSIAMGRKVASAIPHCQAAFLEREGHFSLIANDLVARILFGCTWQPYRKVILCVAGRWDERYKINRSRFERLNQ